MLGAKGLTPLENTPTSCCAEANKIICAVA